MSKLELVLTKRLGHEYSVDEMEALFVQLDRLHDYVAAGQLNTVTSLSRAELQGWLEDIIYTARETLDELHTAAPMLDE